MADWDIEHLGDAHDRAAFDCGQPSLDDFIRTKAGQYERKNVGRTYVAVRRGTTRVVGYYTLALGAVELAHVPPAAAKKLPKHPVPVILLGRLAVDRSEQGKGLGEHLLFDALARSLAIAEQAGAFAVEVLAIDDVAKAFYQRYGFRPLLDQPRHLFLPMATVRQGMRK
ncbi:MAG TPA: GNAT family N-acetyltransferase [Gemmataceae bacterium]|jgi:GNAT superfamily N-acetyltransferase